MLHWTILNGQNRPIRRNVPLRFFSGCSRVTNDFLRDIRFIPTARVSG